MGERMAEEKPRSRVAREFDTEGELVEEYESRLALGQVSIPHRPDLAAGARCDVVLLHPLTGHMLPLGATVAWSDPEAGGIAEIDGFGPEVLEQVRRFVDFHSASRALRERVEASDDAGAMEDRPGEAVPPAAEDGGEPAGEGGEDEDPLLLRTQIPAHVHERLRRLPTHEVYRLAKSGNFPERVALERIYGKIVWEPLLQNQNLTPPEVARIARMGTLPKPLIDTIVSHAGWLTQALVRRALLSNPRLGGRALDKVLRALSKAELRAVPAQTAYPYRVREAAKRLIS